MSHALCGTRASWLEQTRKALRKRWSEAATTNEAVGETPDAARSIYALYRGRHHHDRIVRELGAGADSHMMQLLLRWCEGYGARLHPSLVASRAHGDEAVFRDFQWTVTEDVPALTPLLAVPEQLCIGFKDTQSEDDLAALKRGTAENARESIDETARSAAVEGGSSNGAAAEDDDDLSDGDMCAFFFTAVGLLVNDVLVALNNDLTDPRYLMARALQRTRTCHNAPYLSSGTFANVRPAADGVTLAEVFLQMVHNYVQSGPLTGKVERDMLNWAVSVSLSHSTPLTIAGRRSIGVVPLLHLFPHGCEDINAVPVTRRTVRSGPVLSKFFAAHCPAMSLRADEDYVYVVTTRPLTAGSTVALQAMSPVCNRTEEADDMWRLTCGGPPPEGSVSSADYQAVQKEVTAEVHRVAQALVG